MGEGLLRGLRQALDRRVLDAAGGQRRAGNAVHVHAVGVHDGLRHLFERRGGDGLRLVVLSDDDGAILPSATVTLTVIGPSWPSTVASYSPSARVWLMSNRLSALSASLANMSSVMTAAGVLRV